MSKVSWEDSRGRRTIHLVGEMGYDDVEEISDSFKEAAQTAPGDVVIDFTDVTFVGSNALRLLLSTAREIENKGAKLFLANPRANIRAVFDTTGIFHALPEAEE